MNRGANRKVGVKDIAAAAGVSIGTVDRVLHNRGEVKKETKEKIMAIVKNLGYEPNMFARSLATRKTTRIAIIIPDSSDNNPYWKKPIVGINQAVDELASYNTEIVYANFDASDEESFKHVLREVCDRNPDGIVLNPVFKAASLEFIKELDARNIPYVFIDVNLSDVNNLGYFGQDAEQSGRVAARLMDLGSKQNPTFLVVKQANKKIFSQHIESRVHGFLKYFEEDSLKREVNTITVEIDLLDTEEPSKSLAKILSTKGAIDGVFVPNSRSFKLANFIESQNLSPLFIIGYDLVDENVKHLKKGNISYLISQKPEEQAHSSIMALFNFLLSKKEVEKMNYSPIGIIVKENIEYYNETK